MDTSTPEVQSSNLDPIDEIAALLAGEDGSQDEPTPEEAEDTEAQHDPELDDEGDSDEEQPDPESTEEEEVDESDEEDEEDEDAQAVLAESLGVSLDQLTVDEQAGIKVKVKVGDEEQTKTLKEVIDGFQFNKSNTERAKALAEERKQFESAAQAKAGQVIKQLEQSVALTQALEEELLSEYEGVDWNDLRKFDAAEYAAKQQDYGLKMQRIQKLKASVGQQNQRLKAEQQQVDEAARADLMRKEWSAMLDNNPTWKDQNTYTKDMDELKGFLSTTYGFSDDDFNQVSDSRLIELVKDAKAYKSGKKVAEKKVKKIPKLQKGAGGRKRKKVSKLGKLTRAAKTAKGATKRQLQTDAVTELLLGG